MLRPRSDILIFLCWSRYTLRQARSPWIIPLAERHSWGGGGGGGGGGREGEGGREREGEGGREGGEGGRGGQHDHLCSSQEISVKNGVCR